MQEVWRTVKNGEQSRWARLHCNAWGSMGHALPCPFIQCMGSNKHIRTVFVLKDGEFHENRKADVWNRVMEARDEKKYEQHINKPRT